MPVHGIEFCYLGHFSPRLFWIVKQLDLITELDIAEIYFLSMPRITCNDSVNVSLILLHRSVVKNNMACIRITFFNIFFI